MSGAIALKKTPDGRLLARRVDGRPLTDEDRQQARKLAYDESAGRAWVIQAIRDPAGELRAVQICSAILRDHLWLIFDPTFTPPDDRARYFPGELPILENLTDPELLAAHRAKLLADKISPGGKIRKCGGT